MLPYDKLSVPVLNRNFLLCWNRNFSFLAATSRAGPLDGLDRIMIA